jgi:plasmid maintenance system killer protein
VSQKLGVKQVVNAQKTLRCADGERVPQFEPFRKQAEKRLRVLEAATGLRDLAQLPSNRLEALAGDRAGPPLQFRQDYSSLELRDNAY